ncbi:hypothetical protein [Acidovorax sp.]|uniref:hypothetical protein n=1 Tax=Acidovorax sp. TaxID=1872122 RepID=UPI00391F3AE2
MAKNKLTSDQKREKAKREKAKAKRRREHELNRSFKDAGGLIRAIAFAIEGDLGLSELEDAIKNMGNAKTVQVSLERSAFQSFAWSQLRKTTTAMVSLLHGDPLAARAGLALQGRLYTTDTGMSEWYYPLFVPLDVARYSGWGLHQIFPATAQDLTPTPHEGAYFFGVAVGELALHFALATALDEDVPPEIYLVSQDGWRMLDYGKWEAAIWPMLADTMNAKSIVGEPDDASLAVRTIMRNQPGFDTAPKEERFLNDDSRSMIRSLGSRICMEADELIQAAGEREEVGAHHIYVEGIAKGALESREEILELQKQLERVREEVEILRRSGAPSTPASTAFVGTVQEPARERSLAERMDRLLYPEHIQAGS